MVMRRDDLVDLVMESWWDCEARPPRVSLNVQESGGYSIDSRMRLNWEDPPKGAEGSNPPSDDALSMIAHHEREHLTYCPLLWEEWARWCVQLAKHGYGDPKSLDVALLCNVYADLRVNAGLHKRFGERWTMAWGEQIAFWPASDALQTVFRRAHDHQQATDFSPIPADLKDRLEVEKDAKELSERALDEDLLGTAAIANKYLQRAKQEAKEAFLGSGKGLVEVHGKGTGLGQPRDGREASRRFAAIAEEEGADADDLERAVGAGLGQTELKDAPALIVEFRALRMFRDAAKLTAKVKSKDAYHVRLREPWRLGDDVQRLDVVTTLREFGRVIPGITTVKDRRWPVDRPVDSGKGARLAVLMDESGSIGPVEFERECEAAVGLVALSAERGWEVAAVKFSDGARAMAQGWTRDYLGTVRWLVTRLFGGGTTLTPALQVFERAAGDVSDATVVVLTDTSIYDLQRARDVVASIAGKGAWFRVFMFGVGAVHDQLRKTFEGVDIRFYPVGLDARLAEQVIVEVAP